jgi:hypothetical protein
MYLRQHFDDTSVVAAATRNTTPAVRTTTDKPTSHLSLALVAYVLCAAAWWSIGRFWLFPPPPPGTFRFDLSFGEILLLVVWLGGLVFLAIKVAGTAWHLARSALQSGGSRERRP